MVKEKLTKKDLGRKKPYHNCECIRWGKGSGKGCYQEVERLTFHNDNNRLRVYYVWVDHCKSLDAVHNKVLGKMKR